MGGDVSSKARARADEYGQPGLNETVRPQKVWLELGGGFGDVFARVCGAPADPLVLYVHGSGADNFFDAGSCIDGRLTSAWHWCSQLPSKPFYIAFKLAGFTSFDGQFQT